MKLSNRKYFNTQFSLKKVITLLRVLIGVFFIFSGGSKFWSSSSFMNVLSNYGLIPEILLPIVSFSISTIEIGLGLLLVFGVPKVSLLLLVLVFIFTIATYLKYQGGQVADCGCFGVLLERKINWRFFVENTSLMLLLVIIHYSEA